MPVDAHILTGFLGSGKTSLLRRLLRQPALTETAVLINEFGEVGLDHLLVEPIDGEPVVLTNGCVCCTIRGDVKEALLRLADRRARGEIPDFSRIVIETTGLAEPAPLLATLGTDPMLRHQYRIGNTITVVDAVAGLANLAAFPEALQQVAAADRLVISKTDLASAEAVDRLRQQLSTLNPDAAIIARDEESEAPASLLLDPVASTATVRHNHERPHTAHSDVRSFVLATDEPLDWRLLGLWLSMLLNRHGASILRLKGLARLKGVEEPLVIQGVQHLIHRPEHLARWPDGMSGTRLVVIARGLNPEVVQRSFRCFMHLN